MFAEPDRSAVLGPFVSRTLMSGPLLTNIPHAKLLVPGRCGQHGSIGIPRQALHDVGMFEGVDGRPRRNIPEPDGKIAGGGGEDVLGGGVEQDLSDFSGMPCQLAKGGNVGGLLGIGEQTKPQGDLP